MPRRRPIDIGLAHSATRRNSIGPKTTSTTEWPVLPQSENPSGLKAIPNHPAIPRQAPATTPRVAATPKIQPSGNPYDDKLYDNNEWGDDGVDRDTRQRKIGKSNLATQIKVILSGCFKGRNVEIGPQNAHEWDFAQVALDTAHDKGNPFVEKLLRAFRCYQTAANEAAAHTKVGSFPPITDVQRH